MSENHPGGYLKYERETIGKRHPKERVIDFEHIWAPAWEENDLKKQGERCMDCGVPTCMGGCPIGNIIPDWNDLVSRGDWHEALDRLHATNNFPEFTGYTCPAPCENACVLSINDNPVAIKSIERAIVDKGWEMGWINPEPPEKRTGLNVAIIGSGPAGLSAAQQLNRVGHKVTVFERDDTIGGLMTYGIPDFKFAKHMVKRRVDQLSREGVLFMTNIEVGVNMPFDRLYEDFDAVLLAIGAQKHRNLPLRGRDLKGIYFAMEYLINANKRQAGRPVDDLIDARDKNVIVLGGGDTGADCVATAHRQGARQVIQISINPQKPGERPSHNPWPEQPLVYKKTYAIEEGGAEEFSIDTIGFVDDNEDGHVNYLSAERVEWQYDKNGRRKSKKVLEKDMKLPADLVLVAIGFEGAQSNHFEDAGVVVENGTFKVDENMMTNIPGVFAAGDARRGQSIVVWAIGEGRDAARNIDRYLTKNNESRLPASLQTINPPIGR